MQTTGTFDWVPFYEELADVLVPFRKDRGALIDLVENVYTRTGLKMPTLDYGRPTDMDPFTVFGLFNKGITDSNRTKIAGALGELLTVGTPAPTSFEGIPVLNNLAATFYRFEGDRRPADIENMWELFESALAFAADGEDANRARFLTAHDLVLAQTGIKWNLSMGLYWIRPNSFLGLDGRNRWAIAEQRMLGDECASLVAALKRTPPQGVQYLEITERCRAALTSDGRAFASFPAFSHVAWTESERVNKEKASKAKAERIDGSETIGDEGARGTHYWVYSPGAEGSRWEEFAADKIAGLAWEELGDLNGYESKEAIRLTLVENSTNGSSHSNDALALWQFAHEMEPGDVVYAKRGLGKIVGRGVVESDYRFDAERSDSFRNVRTVTWTDSGEWEYPGQAPVKTLTDITDRTDLVEKLRGLFDAPEEVEKDRPAYTREEFLDEVYMDGTSYDSLVSLLRHKRNVILQGAPGVGKTFMAKRLAYSMMGCKDPDRVELVQFHQSYSYEDFVMGYRPSDNGFALRTGAFYDFCKRAEDDADHDYFFIIDEINRGNLSKIFGELFMLVEPDKRGLSLRLLYSDERFSVPPNIYLIGMMNTADRSLALIDFALRRRFAFYQLEPGFETEGFLEYKASLDSPAFNALIACVERLNAAITADDSLGRGFLIGHSFFCSLKDATPSRLAEIVDYELAPLLAEYWFDDTEKADEWTAQLRRAIAR